MIIATTIFVFTIYSLSLRNDLLISSGNVEYLNYWDLALSLVSEPYLFIYFTLPLWLFICVYHIQENFFLPILLDRKHIQSGL